MPLLFVTFLAFSIWLVGEIPLVLELIHRFRKGPRALPVLLTLCALMDLAFIILGARLLLTASTNTCHLLNLDSLGALFMTMPPLVYGWLFIPVAGLCFVASSFGDVLQSVLFLALCLPPCILYLFSPFLRHRLLSRAPISRNRLLAYLVFFTAYFPLLHVFALFGTLFSPL